MASSALPWTSSRWCTVAESYLEDQKEAVDAALSRTDHIHARVGFPEGPQVGDPAAPEWEESRLNSTSSGGIP
ncbi:hypothetical protein MASR2M78_19350 [Treponema sp.]